MTIIHCEAKQLMSVTVSTPIGNLEISSCKEGLHLINQKGNIGNVDFSPNPNEPVRVIGSETELHLPLLDIIKWLQVYFNNPFHVNLLDKPKICPSALKNSGEFYKKVWMSLYENVSVGSVISYGKLATLAGNSHCSRAVGSAMRRNLFPLLVPCHRVIRSDGKLGQYCGGCRNNIKEWLVKHEREFTKQI